MKLINYIAQSNFPEIEKIALRPKETEQLKQITGILLNTYIQKEIVSEKIAGQINGR